MVTTPTHQVCVLVCGDLEVLPVVPDVLSPTKLKIFPPSWKYFHHVPRRRILAWGQFPPHSLYYHPLRNTFPKININRTSRFRTFMFRTSRSPDIQIPGHPGLPNVQVFQTSSFLNSATSSFLNSATSSFLNSATSSFLNSTTSSFLNSATSSFLNSVTYISRRPVFWTLQLTFLIFSIYISEFLNLHFWTLQITFLNSSTYISELFNLHFWASQPSVSISCLRETLKAVLTENLFHYITLKVIQM